MRRKALWLAAAGLVGLVIGCNKGDKTAPTTPAPGASGPAGGPPMGGPPGGGAGGGTPFDADSGPHADGKKVMVASGCFRCHAVNGARAAMGGPGGFGGGPGGGPPPGGPGGGPPGGGRRGPGGRGPDLGHVAKDAKHTKDWLTKYIKDPKSVNPEARMPAQEGRVKDDDLRKLVDYLATLK